MINFVFDFDSTLVKKETLNSILSLALKDNVKKIEEIKRITKMAMEGFITPRESMNKRLNLTKINKTMVDCITNETKNDIVEGMPELISTLQSFPNINIFIMSGGFKEMIEPVAKILNIKIENIYANNFIYNNDIVSSVEDSLLLEEQGKAKMLKKLKEDKILIGKTIMIGDGWTDLETKLLNIADEFICFIGVIEREKVVANSINVAQNTSELLQNCLKIINAKKNN